MKTFTCDYCLEQTVSNPKIVLNGIPGKSGILLPDYYHEKHFCSGECFWKWVEENKVK